MGYELRPYQQAARDAVFAEWEAGRDNTLLVLPTGCHAKGERLLLADGTSCSVEDIKQGWRLLGADGLSRTVLHTNRGVGELYKIVPVKGKPFVVTKDHKLTLVRTNEASAPKFPCERKSGQLVDVTVEEWLSWSNNKKHIHKLMRCPAIQSFPESLDLEELSVDPYFIGILLGDGGLKYGVNVTTMEPEVVEELMRQAQKYEMHLRSEDAGKAKTYYFVNNNPYGRSELFRELKALGVARQGSARKHIPPIYKYSRLPVRLEILAGLLDSDGFYNGCGGYDFISKSRQLSEDVAFICRSAGLAAYVSECEKSCPGFTGIYYRVSISGNCSIIPCRVSRKKAQVRKQKKNVLRTGFSVEYVGEGEYFGFTVDGDNRYLLDDFTITHNCGKTIVFSSITEECVRQGKRVLILAHRGELLDQAADKLAKSTGLLCATEKAEQSCLGSWFRVVVGSVQTLMREKRLAQFPADYFDTIIVDEAHHCLSDSYRVVLDHFDEAQVLGVTATPDRGDKKNLGEIFDSLAYEYTLPRAIKEGYLVPIKAQTIPLKIELGGVGVSAGDFKTGELGDALEPYLYQIAEEMKKYCADRKTVVFLPLVKTSQKFRDILNERGFHAAEVNGNSDDRAQILKDFDEDKYNVLCNSMLLTEGWDCPSVDCVIVLRPTKVRSLYSQMVGRGTRLHEGKTELLLLDFLWHSERHELCRPAHLICESPEVAQAMVKRMEEDAGGAPVDLEEAEQRASEDVVAQREEALAKQLAEMKTRKRKLVDPLQFEMSIQAEDLMNYVPSFGYEMAPASEKQIATLEKLGIFPDEIDNAGKAALLLDRLDKRRQEGLTTPKQIRFLEGKGFQHVGTWSFDGAKKLIDRIASNGWRVPVSINPATYVPANNNGGEMNWNATTI